MAVIQIERGAYAAPSGPIFRRWGRLHSPGNFRNPGPATGISTFIGNLGNRLRQSRTYPRPLIFVHLANRE